MATWGCSHRLFDLLIAAPQLLGLVDPLTFVLREGLQVQLQTDGARFSGLVHATLTGSDIARQEINAATLPGIFAQEPLSVQCERTS